MALPGFLREQKNGIVLAIKVQPRASADQIGEALGDELKIKVTAPPVDAAANEALLRLLSKTLDVPRNHLELLRGHVSRHKQVFIQGLTGAAVLAKLQQAS